jgi:hypothetical protein
MKITNILSLILSAFLCGTLQAATITFSYDGSDGANSHTTAIGQFVFPNADATSLTLTDLSSFTLHQTANISNGVAIGYFDFTKSDLISFSLTLANGVVTNAAFQTQKRQETSSPTNTDFHAQNFIALTATTAKTQYGDGFTSDDTSGPIAFSSVPEPSACALTLLGFYVLTFRRAKRASQRCSPQAYACR